MDFVRLVGFISHPDTQNGSDDKKKQIDRLYQAIPPPAIKLRDCFHLVFLIARRIADNFAARFGSR